MKYPQHTPDLDVTVEVPFAAIAAARRAPWSRVENPVDLPHPTENLPVAPEIEDPGDAEAPRKDQPDATGTGRWN